MREVERRDSLSSGYWGVVERVYFSGGGTAVRKTASAKHPGVAIEAAMLTFLRDRSRLPVPSVLACDDSGLWLEDVPGDHSASAPAERHAATLLADLHDVASTNGQFGFEFDTLIGPLPQPNRWNPSWPAFFRENRLLAMLSLARNAGKLPSEVGARVEALADRLEEMLPARPAASLVHGDVWSGNVLGRGDRIMAFLDPSLSFSHAEVELAFITLFSTFGGAFYEQYDQHRPIEPGFLRVRKDIYNLYPLLVHTVLFGSTYVPQVDTCLRRVGF